MRLIILGAGGYGQTVADQARQTGKYKEIFFLDDKQNISDVKGKCEEYKYFADADTEMYPAFGNNEIRLKWIKRLQSDNISLLTMIHPLAYVSPKAIVEDGVIIMPYAIVNTNSIILSGGIINCGAIVDHGCVLEEAVHVAPGGIVKAENRIPAKMKIDSGEVIQVRTYSLEK